MSLFAISDLHLSLQVDKPMDIFNSRWENHHEKLKTEWEKRISSEDTVIIGGDLSWALKFEELEKDVEFIHQLPGKKVLFKGNHDYWWNSYKKVKEFLPSSFFAIQNNYYPFNRNRKIALCGTRGWIIPGKNTPEHDQKIYQRELGRLELSLKAALKDGFTNLVVTLHYPPFHKEKTEKYSKNIENQIQSEFVKLLKEYNAKICIYGHLHGEDHSRAFVGTSEGIDYYFVSSDYLEFRPVKIDLSVF